MTANGQTDAQVLCWPKRLLSADDLRRHLTGQRELQLLPRTVVTPLAADELKARGVRVSWQVAKPKDAVRAAGAWVYAVERPDAVVESVVKSLERDGLVFSASRVSGSTPCEWARALAETVSNQNAIAFASDAGLVCCVANKVAGVRAVAVGSVAQAAQAAALAANLVAVAPQVRAYFELRQILRAACKPAACPDDVAKVLRELDGHAHR